MASITPICLFQRLFVKRKLREAAFLVFILLLPENGSAGRRAGVINSDTLMSGFVATSFRLNRTSGVSTFALDQVEVDLVKILSGQAAVRLDLNIHQKGDKVSTKAEEGSLFASETVEQGYISIKDGNHTLSVGKFNAPIGFEFPDPPEKFHISHSMIFEFGLPLSLTGAWLLSDFQTMNLSVYVVNGWERVVDDNSGKTFGWRVGFKPADSFEFGLSHISGDEVGTGSWTRAEKLSVFDFDMTLRSGAGSVIGFEYTRGAHKKNGLLKPGEDDARWNGFLVMTHMKLSPFSGVTLRYDVFSDDDGARLPSSLREKREALTVTSSFTLGAGPTVRFEYRSVTSTERVFEGGNNTLKNKERVFAAELFYMF